MIGGFLSFSLRIIMWDSSQTEKVFRYWVTKVKERERERKKEIYYKLYS